ncbi:helix-turn-helix domain-containing protein [Bacillus sp. EB600]|uniref:helix-turn-helix domain-containing protein n=1 Tax=Bacillus sp. EB600 TaxID=2806345 RepID=UPI00210F19D8|nr:helix-turn-helix transcriptional regulator [Bacillus sp. EB600]MCQ6279246.1 helix-turn-helix transcriptional regulator [Bacillus sp. EB600]
MSLSEKLRMLRDDRCWSQQYLADRMNVDRSTISRYETGKSIPTYQTVVRFAEVYQIEKELLVNELDQILPTVEKSGYILKENLDDKDLDIVIDLIKLFKNLYSIVSRRANKMRG